MTSALSRPLSDRIRRVDVLAYLVAVMGLTFVGDNAESILADGVSLVAVAGTAIGGFAILAAWMTYRNPENVRDGDEPAPAYFYLPVAVSTVALAVLAVSWVG